MNKQLELDFWVTYENPGDELTYRLRKIIWEAVDHSNVQNVIDQVKKTCSIVEYMIQEQEFINNK